MSHKLLTIVTTLVTSGMLSVSSGLWAAEYEAGSTTTTTTTTTGATATSGAGAQAQETLSDEGRKFVTEAAKGNMGEIRLGETAQQQAESQEVREFGQRLVEDHRKANEQLRSIATANHIPWPTSIKEEHRELATTLTDLSGQRFDQKFMQEMVKDHQKDVEKYEKMTNQIQDQQLEQYVQDTLPVLQQHLQRAQEIQGSLGQTQR